MNQLLLDTLETIKGDETTFDRYRDEIENILSRIRDGTCFDNDKKLILNGIKFMELRDLVDKDSRETNVLLYYYFHESKPTLPRIASMMGVHTGTMVKARRRAIDRLTAVVYGLSGIIWDYEGVTT